ncbi:MAG: OmpA family protein [Haliea sp.]
MLSVEQSYELAKNDPAIIRYASEPLERAGKTLEAALAARDAAEAESLTYVAGSQLATARAIAERRAAESSINELSKVKDRVQLEAREAELSTSASRLEEARRLEADARRKAEEARLKEEAALQQLADMQAKQTARGMVLTLGSVLFATGRSELLPGALSSVDRLAAYLEEYQDKTVLIEGHTDSTGSDTTNLNLSQARADAVRVALMTRGIAPSRIVATGLASSQPVASNDTPAGRQQNRRVEIVIQ